MCNLRTFILEIYIANFFDIIFQILFCLLLKEILGFRIYFTNILKTLHILLRFIKANLIRISKMIKNSFILEIDECSLFIFDYFLNLFDDLLIFFTIKNFRAILSIL
jgi:hypothetical protein